MNSKVSRLSFAAAIGACAFAAVAVQAADARADAPPATVSAEPAQKSSNRLYVGNLTWGTTLEIEIYFNPKELTVDKPVP